MFKADFSQATVLALFLMPEHLYALRSKFFDLKPGTRIVSNTFGIEDWDPDETVKLPGECKVWCTALLWIVPAKVEGTWHVGSGELTLKQDYQMISGALASGSSSTKIAGGRLRGSEIRFAAGDAQSLATLTVARLRGPSTPMDAPRTGERLAPASRGFRGLWQA